MEWYVSARFFNRWFRSSLSRSVFCSIALWTEEKAKMGANSHNRHHHNSTSLRRLRILSKYSDTNTLDLEFSNNLLCPQRHTNFKKYLLTHFVDDCLSHLSNFRYFFFYCKSQKVLVVQRIILEIIRKLTY